MGVPTDRRYLETHEWHELKGNICTIGITQFAADELTDITYVSLPAAGTEISAGSPLGEVESVKATSELVSGLSGVVTEVNANLEEAPESINDDPFGAGWIIRLEVSDTAAFESLMTAEAYDAQTGE